jgi:hypothetical protein
VDVAEDGVTDLGSGALARRPFADVMVAERRRVLWDFILRFGTASRASEDNEDEELEGPEDWAR